MSLIYSLMKYKEQGKLLSFDMHGDNKATLHLPNGEECVVYMASQYIVGESDVYDAANGDPKAEYLIYNNWDSISGAAERTAVTEGITVMKFGRFSYKLDEIGT